MNNILEISNLTTQFHTFDRKVIALDHISLNLEKEEILGIVGETGSGKSVLLKSIINLVPYPGQIIEGKVLLNGKDLLKMPEDEIMKVRGKNISIILPNPRNVLNPIQVVGQQVASIMAMHQNVSNKIALEHTLEMFTRIGIPDPKRRMQAYPHELSGGMCQRIVIGMALINSPNVLLADEISSGLDVTVQRQILDLLEELVSDFGSSTIIVTRDFGVVANYCNRVVVMANGKIVEIDYVKYFYERAAHPISLKLLRSTFSAKGKRELGENNLNHHVTEDVVTAGELIELEPDHYVRKAV